MLTCLICGGASTSPQTPTGGAGKCGHGGGGRGQSRYSELLSRAKRKVWRCKHAGATEAPTGAADIVIAMAEAGIAAGLLVVVAEVQKLGSPLDTWELTSRQAKHPDATKEACGSRGTWGDI